MCFLSLTNPNGHATLCERVVVLPPKGHSKIDWFLQAIPSTTFTTYFIQYALLHSLVLPSYHCTLQATPGQAFFGTDMIFNLASIIDRCGITVRKQCQADIHNDHKTPLVPLSDVYDNPPYMYGKRPFSIILNPLSSMII